MKIRTILFIFIIILFTTNITWGQKPNTKTVWVDYIQPPEQPLNSNIKTYYSEVTNGSDKFQFSISKERSRIILQGYEKIDSREEADLIISFKINSTNTEGEVKKVVYEKTLEDKTKVKKTGGKYSVDSYLSYSISFKDAKNYTILKSENGNVAKKTFTSQLFATYGTAVSNYKENKNSVSHDLLREVYEEELTAFISNLNDKYGFPKKRAGIPIARGKGKKHDYSDLENAYNDFAIIGKQFNENPTSIDLKTEINACIQTWKTAIGEYQPKSKKVRIGDKNVGYINFNLAGAYFILEEWDEAIKYLEIVKSTKGQQSLAQHFINVITELKNRHEVQNNSLTTLQ